MAITCPYCGATLNDRDKFCANCGSPKPPMETPVYSPEPYSQQGDSQQSYSQQSNPYTQSPYSNQSNPYTQSPYTQQSNPYNQSPYTQPSTAQPSYSQPSTAQPSYSQPSTAQPSYTQPSTAQPSYTQPSTAQPSYSQPSTAQTPYTQPSNAQSSYTQPSNSQTSSSTDTSSFSPSSCYPPTPASTLNPPGAKAPAAEMSMKWFKFIIYFQLFAACLVHLANGMMLINGEHYGGEASLVYDVFPDLETADILYGLVLIVCAVFAIIVRFRLSGYRANGPALYYCYLGVQIVASILYIIAVNSAIASANITVDDSSFYSNMATSVALLILNMNYFKKRMHLFVN